MNSANSQYIPLENEYILHLRLNISPSAYGYILHRQCVFNSTGLANCGHADSLNLSMS